MYMAAQQLSNAVELPKFNFCILMTDGYILSHKASDCITDHILVCREKGSVHAVYILCVYGIHIVHIVCIWYTYRVHGVCI